MSEIPTNNPKKKETFDDNARKFTVETLDPQFLNEHRAVSFTLIVDWLELGKDSEKKIAHKKFDNGDVQILLITKITKDNSRTSEKEKITEEKYKDLHGSSVIHLEKRRFEFEYSQNNTLFSIKYDEFADSELRILEVDASNEAERSAFDPNEFPSKLVEVTGDRRYYGYRVAEIV